MPCCWLTDDRCSYWPPYTVQELIDNAVKGAVKPKKTWPKYPIRVLFLSSSYELARTTLPIAEETSDLEACFGKRKPKPVKRLISDIENETESECSVQSQPEVSVKKGRILEDTSSSISHDAHDDDAENDHLFLQPAPTAPAVKKNEARSLTAAPVAPSWRIASSSSRSQLSETASSRITNDDDAVSGDKFSQTTTPSSERSSTFQTNALQSSTIRRINDNDVLEGNYMPHGGRSMTPKPAVHPIVQVIPKRVTDMNQSICSESGNGTLDSSALRKIVELLIQLKTSVNTLAEQVRINTMTVQSMTSSTTAEIPDDLNMELPIANQQALDSVEEELKQNRSMYKSLVLLLASKGGSSIKDVTRRIMATLLTNQFMANINWTGQGNKVAFGKLLLLKVISRAIRRNSILRNVTDAEIQREVVRCLHGALDRDGGRRARMRKRAATTCGLTATTPRPVEEQFAAESDFSD